MCGIAGVFGVRAPQVIDKMLGVLAHRGPDEQNQVHGSHFTMGARRLAIQDLDRGGQPVADRANRIWASLNGEVYNFRLVRQELYQRHEAPSLRSDGDTEVLPYAYRAYGIDFVQRLQGMFAIALWDDEHRRGVLVRDRVGEKPLYYIKHGGGLWYASEIKALLCIPGLERSLNREALHHYLTFKNIPSPLTIYKGIRALGPGCRIVFDDGVVSEPHRYWKLSWAPRFQGRDRRELIDELTGKLQQAVASCLVSDVPVGLFLSGGLDSSLVTALAAKMSTGTLKTFTLTYGEGSSNRGKDLDSRLAREVATRYGTDHTEVSVSAHDFPKELPSILSHFDEPFSGAVSTYFLSRVVGQHLKVVLSGDGADELFGSYLTHRLAGPIAEFITARDQGRAPRLELLGEFTKGERRKFMERLACAKTWRWKLALGVFTEKEKQELYSDEVRGSFSLFSSGAMLEELFSHSTTEDPLNRVLEAEFRTQLPDQVLAFTDRLSMAFGLEVRAPFLYTDVVEFVAGVSSDYKIRSQTVKALLGELARPWLPSAIIDRPKEGFVLPVYEWLQGPLSSYVREVLAPVEIRRHGLFSVPVVASLVQRFLDGQQNLAAKILSLVTFQVWYDLFTRPHSTRSSRAEEPPSQDIATLGAFSEAKFLM